MIWAFVCRLDIVTYPRRAPRVILRVPLGSKPRAKRLLDVVGAGRLRDGAYEAEGRDLPTALAELGLPTDIYRAAVAFARSMPVGGRGYKMTREERVRQAQLADAVGTAWTKAVGEVLK